MKTLVIAGLVSGMGLPLRAEEVTVFAASSLKTALDQIAAEWRDETGNVALIAYDSSSKLAKQIEEGAPADLFLSASEIWMDEVEAAGLVAPGSRRAILGNQLVLIAHGADAAPVDLGPGLDLAELLAGGKLAMGRVDSVPAGQYGKEALVSLGLWDAAAPLVAETDTARAALALVETGEAGFGIVYASDAVADDLAADGVGVVAEFPADSHSAIRYPLAVMAGAGPAATEFAAYVQAERADGVFAALGFDILP